MLLNIGRDSFSPDGVIVPSSNMIFLSNILLCNFSAGESKRVGTSMSSIECIWLSRLKWIAMLMLSSSWYFEERCFISSDHLRCSPTLALS